MAIIQIKNDFNLKTEAKIPNMLFGNLSKSDSTLLDVDRHAYNVSRKLQASQSIILLCSYFARWEYILVLASLSWAGGLKIYDVMQKNSAIKRYSELL